VHGELALGDPGHLVYGRGFLVLDSDVAEASPGPLDVPVGRGGVDGVVDDPAVPNGGPGNLDVGQQAGGGTDLNRGGICPEADGRRALARVSQVQLNGSRVAGDLGGDLLVSDLALGRRPIDRHTPARVGDPQKLIAVPEPLGQDHRASVDGVAGLRQVGPPGHVLVGPNPDDGLRRVLAINLGKTLGPLLFEGNPDCAGICDVPVEGDQARLGGP